MKMAARIVIMYAEFFNFRSKPKRISRENIVLKTVKIAARKGAALA